MRLNFDVSPQTITQSPIAASAHSLATEESDAGASMVSPEQK